MSKGNLGPILTFAATVFLTLLTWMLLELNTLGKQVEGLKKAAIYSEQGFDIVINSVEQNRKHIDNLAIQSALNKERAERNERTVDKIKDNSNNSNNSNN